MVHPQPIADEQVFLMSELRKDPVTGRWVIISSERARRPAALVRPVPHDQKDEFNPFLPGNEKHTPGEVLAYRPPNSKPNEAGWWLRVVPNKFPALEKDGQLTRSGDGMFDLMNGIGQHEIVVETTEEAIHIPDMPVEQVQEVIWAYRDRCIELRKDPRFRYVLIFKNYGKEAGASIWHPHSQIIALPVVPKSVQEEMAGARQYFDYKERCVFCDMIAQESKDQKRVVHENDAFIAFCPFASRFPFETWILPKQHDQFFSNITKSAVMELAEIMRGVLRKLKLGLDDPAYNFIIHTAPHEAGPVPFYHWHIEVLPALSRVAGFEWGSGFFINPVPPEDAAQLLREAELPRSASTAENVKQELGFEPASPAKAMAAARGKKNQTT